LEIIAMILSHKGNGFCAKKIAQLQSVVFFGERSEITRGKK
jgi:hypothetical protein